MKAVFATKYGPPEVLEFRDIPKPSPKPNEVLIKVHATTVHVGDTRIRRFDVPGNFLIRFIAKLYLGWNKPRKSILGMELSGVIEEIGENVTKFNVGDEVFASTDLDFGAYVEYKAMEEKSIIAHKPSNISFEEAAAASNGNFTALCVINLANIQEGQKILIYGASGSVGTASIQLAKNLGAEVTAVCSTSNLDLVKSLGAEKVIDYTKEDFTQNGETYDVVFDVVDKFPKNKAKLAGKIYLNTVKDTDRCKFTQEGLIEVKNLIENGKLKTLIDREYKFEEIIEAHRYVDTGRKKGNVVLKVK